MSDQNDDVNRRSRDRSRSNKLSILHATSGLLGHSPNTLALSSSSVSAGAQWESLWSLNLILLGGRDHHIQLLHFSVSVVYPLLSPLALPLRRRQIKTTDWPTGRQAGTSTNGCTARVGAGKARERRGPLPRACGRQAMSAQFCIQF